MFHKTTFLGLLALASLVPLASTPKALGQQVIVVRDPQTGQRYVADLSAHPRHLQEGQAIIAELARLQSRANAIRGVSSIGTDYAQFPIMLTHTSKRQNCCGPAGVAARLGLHNPACPWAVRLEGRRQSSPAA
jgi:hypothetical protein